MFARCLTDLPFTSETVSQYMNHSIQAMSFRSDRSLLAVATALLMDRLPVGERFNGVVFTDPSGYEFTRRVRNNSMDDYHNLFFVNVNCDTNNIAEVMSSIDDKVKNNFTGFELVEVIGEWWKQHNLGTVRLYINPSRRSTLFFVHSMNIKRFHLATAFINRMLPWLFKDKPLNENEQKLVTSLTRMDGSDEFVATLQELYDAIDFRSKNIERYVKDFEKNSYQSRIDSVNRRIANKREEMRLTMDRYRGFVDELDNMNTTLAGLLCRQADALGNELVEYFVANKELIPNGDGDLGFVVNTYLEYFDTDMADRMLSNHHSYMYDCRHKAPGNMRDNVDAIEKFWRAIFSDEPVLKIKMCSNYHFSRGSIGVISGYNYPLESVDHIPNPHINKFACLGAYQMYIQQALDSNDIITAIQQCIASARSVNIGESVSVAELIRWVYEHDYKCIELPDGTAVTPAEAYEYLVMEDKK